jgi:hypothetical protein
MAEIIEIPANLTKKYKKLFPKYITKRFDKQGDTSQKELKDIKVLMKIFNPVGAGTWYLYEQYDTDVFMCFANLGNAMFAECGTVSIFELLSLRLPMGMTVERDQSFEPMSLQDVIDKIKSGGHV